MEEILLFSIIIYDVSRIPGPAVWSGMEWTYLN